MAECVARAVFEIQRRVRDVAQNRAGGGVFARAAPIEKRVAHHVAAHKDGVKNMIDTGQNMGVGTSRIENSGLHALLGVPSATSGWQFDCETQLAGKFNVRPVDGPDALDVNLLRPESRKTVGKRGENADFVFGIKAVNIQGGVRFGVSRCASANIGWKSEPSNFMRVRM